MFVDADTVAVANMDELFALRAPVCAKMFRGMTLRRGRDVLVTVGRAIRW